MTPFRVLVAISIFVSNLAFGAEVKNVDKKTNQLTVVLSPTELTLVPEGVPFKIRFKPKGRFWIVSSVQTVAGSTIFEMKAKIAPLRAGLGFRMFDMEGKPLTGKPVGTTANTEVTEQYEMPEEVIGTVGKIIASKKRVLIAFPEDQIPYFRDKAVGSKLIAIDVNDNTEFELIVFLKKNNFVVFDVDELKIDSIKPGMNFQFPIEGIEIEDLGPIIRHMYITPWGPMGLFQQERSRVEVGYVVTDGSSSLTVDEGDPQKFKETGSQVIFKGSYMFGGLGGMRLSYQGRDLTSKIEDFDVEAKLVESSVNLDLAFQVAGFAAGLLFETSKSETSILDSKSTTSFNRASVFVGYVTPTNVLSLGYVPKTNAERSSSFEDGRKSKTEILTAQIGVSWAWNASKRFRLLNELGFNPDNGEDDGVELTSNEKLSYLGGFTYLVAQGQSLSTALIRNRSVMVAELVEATRLGQGSAPRTGLALGYSYAYEFVVAGVGLEYYSGGISRTAESTDNETGETTEVDQVVEHTRIAGGLWFGYRF